MMRSSSNERRILLHLSDRAKLVLSEPQAIYYAGQVISGHVEVELEDPIQFSAINVTFHGEARVNWSEVDYEEYNGVQRAREVNYNGVQQCLHYIQCLYGTVLPGRGEGLIDLSTLPPGKQEIPFNYTLPSNIPSTFKGEKGKVSYTVTACVEYLNEYLGNDDLCLEFEVVAPLDLLADEIVRPLEMHFEEVYSCWCSSSPMRIDIKCPVSGYCPGQSIPINVKVHNKSTVEVKKIVFQIVKKVLYRSLQPPSEYVTPQEVLATIKTGAILSNSDKGFTCHLPVPAMIAPNLDNCEIIDIGFFLKATIKITGCNDDLEDEALFFIGLRPIPGTPGAEDYVHPLAHMLPNGAPIPDSPLRANVEQVFRPDSNSYRSSYPGQNTVPSAPEAYPASNPTNDIAPPYPGQPNLSSRSTSSYPPQNPPYPTSNSPYPPSNSPHHHHPDSPNPTPNPPSSKSDSISIRTDFQNPSQTALSIRMTSFRTQTIGFDLSDSSSHPTANDDQSTPLMQNYPSPSAPPPSS